MVVIEMLNIKNDPECEKFVNWLALAEPKEKYCYYKGKFLSGSLIGKVAFKAYNDGKVTLFQSREEGVFSYWAQRR